MRTPRGRRCWRSCRSCSPCCRRRSATMSSPTRTPSSPRSCGSRSVRAHPGLLGCLRVSHRKIGSVRRFCMSTQNVEQPNAALSRPGQWLTGPSAVFWSSRTPRRRTQGRYWRGGRAPAVRRRADRPAAVRRRRRRGDERDRPRRHRPRRLRRLLKMIHRQARRARGAHGCAAANRGGDGAEGEAEVGGAGGALLRAALRARRAQGWPGDAGRQPALRAGAARPRPHSRLAPPLMHSMPMC